MSRKTPVLIISICTLILSMVISSIPIASTSATTTLSVSPESIVGPPPDIGETFNINVIITNVINLTGCSVGLKWTPAVLECLTFDELFGAGTFLGPLGNWLVIAGTIDNTAGEVYPPDGCVIKSVANAPNGTGTLITVSFNVTNYGFSRIDVINYGIESFIGGNKTYVPVDLINGTFTLFTAPPAAPLASFTYSPSTPKFNQTVTFNASASEPGWNGTADVPIASYTWDFDDGNITVIGDDEPLTPIITHVYPVNDTYTVNLTVTCEYDAMLDMLGLLSDSTWQDVTIKGPVHDVAVIDVTPSLTEVIAGETVTVSVTAENQGDFTETFDVTAYYDNTEIGTQTVLNLAPGSNETLSILWNTIDVDGGDYTIKAVASTVTGEKVADQADNTLINGMVKVTLPATKLSIIPTSILGPPPGIGETFSINVTIINVVNLTDWQVGLAWNASVLQCLSFTPQFGAGMFLGSQGNWIGIEGTIDNTAGEVYPPYAYSHLLVVTPPNGSGTIAQVVFNVTNYGFTWINLTNIMIKSNRTDISVDLIDGAVAIFEIPPAAPLASFIYSPSAPDVGEQIEFDASASLPGWNGTADVPIATYTWDFDDGNVTTVTSPIIYHAYTAAGTYTVNLTVTCEYDAVLDSLGLLSNSTGQDVTTTAVAVHDVAVISVTPSPTEVTAGETVTVNVTVANQGDFTETFTVTAYYDNTVIDTGTVTNLASGSTITLTFTWNTTDVDEGDYTIKAVASAVAGETDTADNTRTDGTVTVTVEAPAAEIPWLWIILVIVIVVILIIVYMLMRRRKSKPK